MPIKPDDNLALFVRYVQQYRALEKLRASIAEQGCAVLPALAAQEVELAAALVATEATLRAGGVEIDPTSGHITEYDTDSREGNFISGGLFLGSVIGKQVDNRQGVFIERQLIPERRVPHQPWIMPHSQNPLFLGRATDLEHLGALLTAETPTSVALLPALAGVGGIGKTQLAIEFAHRFRAQFPGGVFWLSMEQPDTIAYQVAYCGGQAGLQLFDETFDSLHRVRGLQGPQPHDDQQVQRLTLAQQVSQVRAAWEESERRLLIFDNLEEPTLLEQWRPHGGGTRVLITTRNERWAAHSGVQLLALHPLTDLDSLVLLLRPRAEASGRDVMALLAEPEATSAAEALVQELGGLPLALALAGNYLAERGVNLVDYLSSIRQESIQHVSLNTQLYQSLPTGHATSIIATFALSAARLRFDDATDQYARAIWQSAAQLAPEPLPSELLLRLINLDPTQPAQRESGDLALLRLRELGLLEQAREGQTSCYRQHRLLGAYARSTSADPTRDRNQAEAAIVAEMQWLESDGRLSEAPVRYGEHLQYLALALDGRSDLSAAAVWNELGKLYEVQEAYQRARLAFEKALTICQRLPIKPHAAIADTLHHFGILASVAGEYATARAHLTNALALRKETLGQVHRATAATMHELGRVAYLEADYTLAYTFYTNALALRKETLGRVHRATATTLYELGKVALAIRDYAVAYTCLTDALAIREQTLGSDHRDIAHVLHQLGHVAYEQGNYVAAHGYFVDAHKIKEQSLGQSDLSTAMTLHELGRSALGEGKPAAARSYLTNALAIREHILGPLHSDVGMTLHHLGTAALAEQDYTVARTLLNRALTIKEQTFGRVHSSTAATLHELGRVALAEGDCATARFYLTAALAIEQQTGGRIFYSTAYTLHEFGNLACRERDYAAAWFYYTEALTIKDQTLGRLNSSTAATLFALGNLAYRENQVSEARRYLGEALAVNEQLLGVNHPETVNTRNRLEQIVLGRSYLALLWDKLGALLGRRS